jgi:hypothetical protein
MTDRAQFEAMLEALINEDQETAKEIFHNIVVGKSREIYEELLESDFGQDQGNPYAKNESADDEMEESEEEESSNPFASKEEEGEDDSEEGEDDGEEGDEEEDGEEGDDAEFDGEEDDSEEGEGDIEDRVMDLEDALEDLKAEFEQMLQGEEHEEEGEPGIHGDGEPMHDIEADMMGGHEEPAMEDELASLMEYVNKVAPPKHGDNGQNTRSAVAGENNMGGTAGNIAQSFEAGKGGTEGGLASPKVAANPAAAGNMNVPGGDAGKKAFKKKEPGHGAEKAGSKETADNKQSTLRPLKK